MHDLLEKYTTKASRFLVIDGTMVHYRIEGKGEPLLLIHGSFSSLHTFDRWTEILKTEFMVIRIDLPGFGLSGCHPDANYDMKYFIDFVYQFCASINLNQCYLAGNSLGGWLAWELTLAHPEMVKKLILIDSAGFISNRNLPLPIKIFRTSVIKKVIKYAIRRNIIEQYLKDVYADESKITQALIDRYFDLFSKEGNVQTFSKLVNAKVEDHTPLLSTINQPTLILWGEQDKWLDVNHAYRFKINLPNATLITYPSLGHVPMEENPELTAQDLIHFMGQK